MTTPSLFPAKITMPDGSTREPARVATTDAGVGVWVWDGGPVEVAMFDPGELTSIGARRYQATDGTILEPARGCGCGHPLKRWKPDRMVSSR